jgi:hypothetical protein
MTTLFTYPLLVVSAATVLVLTACGLWLMSVRAA